MKMTTKKKVFVVALAVALIAILSFSSLAWFNATDTATNQFKIADSNDPNTTPDFSVDVIEHDGTTEKDGLEFDDVAPGATLAKDPIVKNTGEYGLYARVIVTLSDAATWNAAAARYSLATDTSGNMDLTAIVDAIDTDWVRFDNIVLDTTADTLTYVYYYGSVIAKAGESDPLFTEVKIPGLFEQSDMDYGTDNTFTITVKADAVQSDNILDGTTLTSGNHAYKAFATANWPAGSAYPSVP